MIKKFISMLIYPENRLSSECFWKLRMKCQTSNKLTRIFYKSRYQRYLLKQNSFIPLTTQIEGMPVFPHGENGILISGGAKIGKNCVIFHQVTIGSNTLSDSKGQGTPIIGDNCYIGAGAKIIGNVKIGNNVRVGANVVITKDVPDNTTVVSSPVCFITKEKLMNNEFITYGELENTNKSHHGG